MIRLITRNFGALLISLVLILISSNASMAMSGIKIQNAWVRAVPPVSKNTAFYVHLNNPTAQDDALLAVHSSIAEVGELHTVVKNGDLMMMRPVEKITIPAHGEAMLKPGGFHAMLINLKKPLKTGEKVHLKLKFLNAGEIEVMAVVQESEMAGHPMKHDPPVKDGNHSKMKHGKKKKEDS